jgi:fructan beta-fructosidase
MLIRLNRVALFATFIALSGAICRVAAAQDEPFRPRFHFTPQRNWMNDPNGMVFFDG